MEHLKIVYEVLSTGGPFGIAALLFVFYWLERKERQELQQKVFDLATKQIEVTMKLETSVNALKDLFTQISSRI